MDEEPSETVTVSVVGDVSSFFWSDQSYAVDSDGNVTLPRAAVRHFESFGVTFKDPNPVSSKSRSKK